MNDHNLNFYKNLPAIDNFFDASNLQKYHALPQDWHIAVSDIVNSTSAIEQGHHERVNMLGAAPIVGILNMIDRHRIPYTFSGDGSVFCIPTTCVAKANQVLETSRYIGRKEYGLDLRAAVFPIGLLRRQGYDIRIAKYQASPVYEQAIFYGGGIRYAETILKNQGHEKYRVQASDNSKSVDFSGLECRWQKVKQQEDKEVITLLVQHNPKNNLPDKVYTSVLQKIQETYGFEDKVNPIDISQLSMNLSFKKLRGEIKFHTSGLGWSKYLGYMLKLYLQTIIGKVLMGFGYKTEHTDWSQYKGDLAQNSDYRKFDDMLRLVISGSSQQRKELIKFLEQRFKEKKLAYGIHVTDAAVITCMVFQYHRQHIHFVDGSGGGYVSASKGLKQRLQILAKQ